MKTRVLHILILTIILAFSIFLPEARGEVYRETRPPVAQPMVRQGDLVIGMAEALNLGTFENETEAEKKLVDVNVTPKEGWKLDYPVSPSVIGELRESIIRSIRENRLPLSEDEALSAFDVLIAEFGLPVWKDTEENYAMSQPTIEDDQYVDSNEIDGYYSKYGPPLVTYYSPPWKYYDDYTWIHYPFWYGRFRFSGFFLLHDHHPSFSIIFTHRHFRRRPFKVIHRPGIGIHFRHSTKFGIKRHNNPQRKTLRFGIHNQLLRQRLHRRRLGSGRVDRLQLFVPGRNHITINKPTGRITNLNRGQTILKRQRSRSNRTEINTQRSGSSSTERLNSRSSSGRDQSRGRKARRGPGRGRCGRRC